MSIETTGTVDQIALALSTLRRGPRVQRLHRVLTARAGIDLDRPAFTVLAALSTSGPLRVSDLAEMCIVDVSTMSRQVSRLACSGLVEQEQDPTDRRAVLIRLSDEGEGVTRRLLKTRNDLIADVVADWSVEDRATFAALLSRFVRDLEQFDQASVPQVNALGGE
jgi:DNA-binding MarR family transcriptional regulator